MTWLLLCPTPKTSSSSKRSSISLALQPTLPSISYQLRFGFFPRTVLYYLEKAIWKYVCPFSSFPINYLSGMMSLFPGAVSPKQLELSFPHKNPRYPQAAEENWKPNDLAKKIQKY